MKTKFFLFVSLVLLAVQGWALPVDSLTTYATGLIPNGGFFDVTQTTINPANNVNSMITLSSPSSFNIHIDETLSFDTTAVGTTKVKQFQFTTCSADTDFIDVIVPDRNHVYRIEYYISKIEQKDYYIAPPQGSIGPGEWRHYNEYTWNINVIYSPTMSGSHIAVITLKKLNIDYDPFYQVLYSKTSRTFYELYGCAVNPTITVDKTLLNFGKVLINKEVKRTFSVKCPNLTGDLSLSLSADSSFYIVNPRKITAEEAASGTTVSVTYNPIEIGNHNATLTISGCGAKSKVSLLGECVANQNITVSQSSYDFGPVNAETSHAATFTVTGINLNDRIVLTWPQEEGFTVTPDNLPATGGKVTVTFKPTYEGRYSQEITLSSGDAIAKINVVGNCVIPPTITVDQTPLNFGTVNLGDDPKTKVITVKGTNLASDLNLSISGASGSMFTALPYRISPADAAAGRPVVVTYKPTAVGTHTATLVITGGGVDPVEISLSGKCLPAPTINVNPSIYDFGTINLGDTKTKTFTVTGSNSSERISVVNQMETTGGEYTISPTSLPASGGTVTVTFKPLSAGSSGAVFTLSNGVASCKITVEGNCASITASPSSWNFGSVAKNSTNTKKITVKGYNLTGNLTITPESNSYFTVSPATITAAQAQSANGVEVTVTYKPTAVGNHSATFTISDGVASKSISLSGKCEYLTVNPSTYDFGTVVKGNQSTKTFTVTGSNSSERISVVNQMETTGGEYTISPTSLPASGGTVTVTFKPLSAGSSGAVFTLSNGVASCKITVEGKCVNPPTPTITTSTTSLVFGGYNDSRTFRVTGTNLTGSLTLTSNNSIFTVTPSTITASQAANGVTVTVKCNAATNIQHATGKVTISGGGASPKYVNLTLDATGPQPYAPLVTPEDEGENGNDEFSNVSLQEAFGGPTSGVNELSMSSKVNAEGLNIIIETPIEQKALISDIAGHIREVNLQAGRNEVPVNANGIYIVRIREKSTKLMLK